MKKITHHIVKLRNQPEEIRRHVLHAVTIIFAVLLLSLWVYSLGTKFTNTSKQSKVNDNLEPFSALKANFVGGYYSLTNPTPAPEE